MRSHLVFNSLLFFGFVSQGMAQNDPALQQAQTKRMVSGSLISEKGFSTGETNIAAGTFLPVDGTDMSSVYVRYQGNKVKLPKDSVTLSTAPRNVSESGGAPAATISSINVVSAKYGFPRGRQSNVKNHVEKLLPSGPITTPVKILVSDALLGGGPQDRVNGTITLESDHTGTIALDKLRVLTVQYSYNGQALTKQAPENTYLVLP